MVDHHEEKFAREIKNFYDSAPVLKDRSVINEKLKEFIERHSHGTGDGISARKIVCITSGGTTVPLEQRCVRLITSVQESKAEVITKAVTDHHSAVQSGLLLKLRFTTIFEYLQLLHTIAVELRDFGPRAMFYLAAAVSDFYVPWESMAENKIQSGGGPLNMHLVQVPKMLSVLRKDWAPRAFGISFKLETDIQILLEKASAALEKYNMHAVVANELETRKEEVTVVTPAGNTCIRRDKSDAKSDVESPLIKLLVEMHALYIQENPQGQLTSNH